MNNEQMVSVPFRREDRYIVIKRKDLAKVPVAYRSHLVDPMFSLLSHLPHRECLVIESDWPEYEPTWAAIEARATGKPAAQHQGEPVALPARLPMRSPEDRNLPKGHAGGWNACLDEIAKLGPLYTHADAGEVERLREGIAKHWKVVCDHRAELDTLRAQWSEARTLLLELEGDHTLMLQMGASEFGQKECKTLRARLLKLRTYLRTNTEPMANTLAALSASAEPSAPDYPRMQRVRAHKHTCANVQPGSTEADICDCGAVVDGKAVEVQPSAPVERDERAAIKDAYRNQAHHPDPEWPDNAPYFREFECGWQARAALERKPEDGIPDFSPGSGNKAERRATALVAQLQADLTARDERIDELERFASYIKIDPEAQNTWTQSITPDITVAGSDAPVECTGLVIGDGLDAEISVSITIPKPELIMDLPQPVRLSGGGHDSIEVIDVGMFGGRTKLADQVTPRNEQLGLVLPERGKAVIRGGGIVLKSGSHITGEAIAIGWDACIDEVCRLNGVKS
ncbi:hypothetical protein [Pseudomonas vranovensis]|uniref:hypothetical protein n=1 Tax=Pseudomonas vranovensis TaxID=321661 RepID=UPI003D95B302